MDHEPVARDQQNLEEDEEVEGVARQEGAADPHELELEERVEMLAAPVPAAADRVELHHQREKGGERHHHRRQPVEDQHDAEGRGPVAEEIGLGRIGGGGGQKHARHAAERDGRGQREDPLQHEIVAHEQHDQGRDHGRQDDGGNDPVVHWPASSSLSIRSVPASRKAPSATITITAVMPKEITMAVSTSAWVNGSV